MVGSWTRGQQVELAVGLGEHPVVVVALAELELLVVLVDAGADGGGLAEVKRRAVHGRQFAGRDQGAVHRGVSVGGDHDDVAEDVAFAGEIEIGVLGQVDDGVLVGGGGVFEAQRVVVGQRVERRSP